ncbi:uncharacterized protein F5Z01DRAFT_634104 [Emericellopsis atlantica]|uniref:Uncharacterized protein n=1 Tax=Emericellopsis atlantica TaxID=2614577 RepID=A0A9P7ZRJ9_9HYPO|nr:uncharacterized protein F5Z01DRAFT_634104 [Emericellopsis atlantica]KAG9256521.1 hypothetical protein F5Z01DRAFT_634104 [Emericellopsis atlantica]
MKYTTMHLMPQTWLYLLATASTISATPSAFKLGEQALEDRSSLCPVVCDDTWCCLTGQICQAASEGDIPYVCDDPLLAATESAFALGPLSIQVESVLSDNSAFISSLAATLSLTLTFTTSLPDDISSTEPTTIPEPSGGPMPPSLSISNSLETARTTQPSASLEAATSSSSEEVATTTSEDAAPAVTGQSWWSCKLPIGIALAMAL